ncbi:GH36-type glycosyl hydrolase domain-containing protein [Spirochaeta isovalerica]|uniref:Cellobiose phosphorylase n=1 Tax=Spirochaeta isovalerica TaxID=150 RepID=A0A841RGB7_9SPIO|nr:glycosyl transferase [Spirochaeta isovalerica]MBB6481382.1 cellobiose phosphorylase [Spirochaeta isovalerica]
MNCGYFLDEKKEYIITTPKTPTKWINYIGTLEFGGFVDHTGGGVICAGDPALNRITKYIPQIPLSQMNGETLYIRLHRENGEYDIFSPFYTPVLKETEDFRCAVGLGYNRWSTVYKGIEVEILIFSPRGSRRIIRSIKVTNKSPEKQEIDIIPVVEYTHFDALKQFTNADWAPQTMESMVLDRKEGLVVLGQAAYMMKDRAVNYLTSNRPVSSFETDRSLFLGNGGYGSWQDPRSLHNKELSSTCALRGDNIGALLHHMGPLEPGESERLITQLGQTGDISKELNEIEYYRKEENVDAAFRELSRYWEGFLSVMQTETPSPSFNSMINIHNPRQCYMTKNWSRYLSLYQLGLGARGLGFRDSSQDVMGVLSQIPDEAAELIGKLLSTQKRNGSAMHQFFPLTMEANGGDSREEEDRADYYGDDHLWIILAVCEYLKETGDLTFLKKEFPFYDKDKAGLPVEKGTVLEHLKRGLNFTWENRGSHGLPLLGFADWNDTVNLPIGAESLFIASQFGVALREIIPVCEEIGDRDADLYKDWYTSMKDIVNREGWDGEWYRRYYDHKGKPLGSVENDKGKIFTNGQSWPVISGFAEGEKRDKALDSVYRHLNTSKGIKLSTPGYEKFDPEVGGVTTYRPGAKENGGIFLHSNPWVIIAETINGNGNRAFEYYSQINPAAKNEIIEEYEVEPYCYAQNILGDEHPQFGLGRNSWLSGTASWMYQAGTKYILGIKPELNGLSVNPCIPAEWDGFKTVRRFRGKTYRITVKNPRHLSKGVKSLTVNGEKIKGVVIPSANYINDGEITVEAVIGE